MTARDGWMAAFLVFMFAAPALRLLSSEHQMAGDELVTISGLLGVVFLAATIILPTRLRSVTRAFGIESVMMTHRFLGISAAILILLHVGLVVATDPSNVGLLIPMDGMLPEMRGLMGSLATLAVLALVLAAAYRRGRYQVWRGWHIMLTWLAWLAACAHVVLVGHLMQLRSPDVASSIFLLVVATLVVGIEIWRWAIRPLRGKGLYHVTMVSKISDHVSSVRLRPARRRGIASEFRPGQFAWVRTRRAPLFSEEHPFTVSSAPRDRPTIEFTIQHSGDWTAALRTLRAGDELWLDGPHGNFTPTPHGRGGIVLIAGGVGLTPMMSILRAMMANRRSPSPSPRSVCLILTDRPGRGLFRQELGAMQADLPLTIYELGGTPLSAEALVDFLPVAFLRTRLDYYLCGSPSLVTDGMLALRGLKIPERRIHTERFGW